jgi:hypothetical protein
MVRNRCVTDSPRILEIHVRSALASALSKKKDVNGEKGAMAGHLRKCEFATTAEKGLAARAAPTKKEKEQAEKREKAKRKQAGGEEDDVEADDEGTEVI